MFWRFRAWLWRRLGWRWVYWFEKEGPQYFPQLRQGWRFLPGRWRDRAQTVEQVEYREEQLLTVYFESATAAQEARQRMIQPERVYIWFETVDSKLGDLPVAWQRRAEMRTEPPADRSQALPWHRSQINGLILSQVYFTDEDAAQQAWSSYQESIVRRREELERDLAQRRLQLARARRLAALAPFLEHREHWAIEVSALELDIQELRMELERLIG